MTDSVVNRLDNHFADNVPRHMPTGRHRHAMEFWHSGIVVNLKQVKERIHLAS